MTKPLVLRAIVREDADAAAAYYLKVAGEDVALRFVEQLEEAKRKIANRPATGSSLIGHDLKIDGLRSRKLDRFPYLVIYLERRDHIDVLRVLHAQRDIPASLQETNL